MSYTLQRALEIILTLNPNTTTLQNAKDIAQKALDKAAISTPSGAEKKPCNHPKLVPGKIFLCPLCGCYVNG